MKITDVGLARVKEKGFKIGLGKLLEQLEAEGKTEDVIFQAVSVFIAMELCADKNAFVELPEGDEAKAAEITRFLKENCERIQMILLPLVGWGVGLPN